MRRVMRTRHVLRLCISMVSLSLLLMWTLLFSQAPTASAHAFVIGSDPVDGSTIQSPPTRIRIFFNADISAASAAHVYVFAPGGAIGGQLVDGGRSFIVSGRELDTPLLAPSTLPQGSYEIFWTAIATDDGHATSGLIGFNVGHSATGLSGAPTLGPTTSNSLPHLSLQGTLAILWEWLTSVALALWVGIVILETILLLGVVPARDSPGDHTPVDALRKQARPLQWLCLVAMLVGEVIILVLRGSLYAETLKSSGIDPGLTSRILLDTTYGHLWLARMVLILLAIGLLWWTTGRQRGKTVFSRAKRRSIPASRLGQVRQQVAEELRAQRATRATQEIEAFDPPGEEQTSIILHTTAGAQVSPAVVPPTTPTSGPLAHTARSSSTPFWQVGAWLALAALILLTIAFSGDAVQLSPLHISAIALNWLHLVAQSLWFGGVAYLGFILIPALPTSEPDHHGELLVSVLRYYVPLLLAAFGVLVVSGIFLAETTLNAPGQWLNDADPYGRIYIVKVSLLLLMAVFSGYSFLYLRRQLRRQVALLPVVDADMPARRARRSAIEKTEGSMKRAMHILALLGAAVLLCASLLFFFAPPIVFPQTTYSANPASTSGSANGPQFQTKTVGNLSISLEVLPAKVNQTNTVIVMLKDSAGNPVGDARAQMIINMVIMDMGTAHKTLATQNNNAVYVATILPDESFSMFGDWAITLSIQRPNQAPIQTQFVVTLSN